MRTRTRPTPSSRSSFPPMTRSTQRDGIVCSMKRTSETTTTCASSRRSNQTCTTSKKKSKTPRAARQSLRDELAARQQELTDRLAAVSRERDALAARLEREKADTAIAAELAQLQALKAAATPVSVNVPAPRAPVLVPAPAPASVPAPGSAATPSAGLATQPQPPPFIPNPGGGDFQCPVSGAGYSNNYGPRGSGFHYGIDMFAPTGTPLVAVKSGSISYVPNGGAGGNEAYLAANDGNVYYYAHLSAFVGGARGVSQGEVIGLVGSTGNFPRPTCTSRSASAGQTATGSTPIPPCNQPAADPSSSFIGRCATFGQDGRTLLGYARQVAAQHRANP